MPAKIFLHGLCQAMLLLLLTGCGGEEGPDIATVKGTVTLDGEPLDRGFVYFFPDTSKGSSGPTAMGEIRPDGSYEIQSSAGREGAVVGWHKIRVECRAQPKDYTETEPPSLIPERYDNPDKSGLTAEVKGGEENIIPLKLTSKP